MLYIGLIFLLLAVAVITQAGRMTHKHDELVSQGCKKTDVVLVKVKRDIITKVVITIVLIILAMAFLN